MFQANWMTFADKTDNWFTYTGSWLGWLRRAFKVEGLGEIIFHHTLNYWNGRGRPGYAIVMGRVACLVKEIELAHALGHRFVGLEESKERGPYLTFLQPTDEPPHVWLDLQTQVKQ